VGWTAFYDGGIANNDEVADTATGSDGSVAVTASSVRQAGDRDIVTIVYAPDGTRRWLARFNGKIPNWPQQETWNDVAQNVRFDAAGNVYVTGWTWRGMDVDGGTDEDVVVLKYSPAGTLLWKRLYNGPVDRSDFPTDLEIDSAGNVYIAGYSIGGEIGVQYYYESVAIKFSPTGVQQWAQRYSFGQRGDIADSAALDAAERDAPRTQFGMSGRPHPSAERGGEGVTSGPRHRLLGDRLRLVTPSQLVVDDALNLIGAAVAVEPRWQVEQPRRSCRRTRELRVEMGSVERRPRRAVHHRVRLPDGGARGLRRRLTRVPPGRRS